MTLISVSCVFKAFIKIVITFIGKGSSAIERPFKVAEVKVVDNIKGVNRHDLRQ